MIGGTILLLAALFLGAAAVYFLRRFEALAALLAGAISLASALELWRSSLTEPVSVAGRSVWVGEPFAWQDLTLTITPAARVLSCSC